MVIYNWHAYQLTSWWLWLGIFCIHIFLPSSLRVCCTWEWTDAFSMRVRHKVWGVVRKSSELCGTPRPRDKVCPVFISTHHQTHCHSFWGLQLNKTNKEVWLSSKKPSAWNWPSVVQPRSTLAKSETCKEDEVKTKIDSWKAVGERVMRRLELEDRTGTAWREERSWLVNESGDGTK